MDINEIKRMKAETERAIRDMLIKFSQDTGLIVENVRFDMLDITNTGGKRNIYCSSVEMDVRLG